MALQQNKVNIAENRQNTSILGSVKKPWLTRAKSTRTRESSRRPVGLGEAGADDDTKGDCKQS